MVRPVRARLVAALTATVCVNVSGLLQVGRCCGQAMMRSARSVPNKWDGLMIARFFGRAYAASIYCFVIRFEPSKLRKSVVGRRSDGLCCEARIMSLIRHTGPGQDDPSNPGALVRECDDNFVVVHA